MDGGITRCAPTRSHDRRSMSWNATAYRHGLHAKRPPRDRQPSTSSRQDPKLRLLRLIRGLEYGDWKIRVRSRYTWNGESWRIKYKVFIIAPACTPASEWQTPVARTLIRIWPSSGCRSSTSSTASGAFASLKIAALNVLGRLGAMLRVDCVDCSEDELQLSKGKMNSDRGHAGEDGALYRAPQIHVQDLTPTA